MPVYEYNENGVSLPSLIPVTAISTRFIIAFNADDSHGNPNITISRLPSCGFDAKATPQSPRLPGDNILFRRKINRLSSNLGRRKLAAAAVDTVAAVVVSPRWLLPPAWPAVAVYF